MAPIVAFDSLDEAVELANGTEYGLRPGQYGSVHQHPVGHYAARHADVPVLGGRYPLGDGARGSRTTGRRANSVDAAYREVNTALDHLSAALGLQHAA